MTTKHESTRIIVEVMSTLAITLMTGPEQVIGVAIKYV